MRLRFKLGTYERMRRTWDAHSSEVRELLISNVKADLARRIASTVTITEVEPTDPPSVEDERAFEEELRQELEHSYERLNIPESKRRRTNGMLRDSSVELSGPLHPPMDDRLLIPLEEVMKLVV